MKEKNISGERFGKLTAVEKLPSDGKSARWKCICDCGSSTTVRGSALRYGSVKSCGCGKNAPDRKIIKIDHTGLRYGRLTAIARARNEKFGRPMWDCICDCGIKTTVRASDLLNGNTQSCGCRKNQPLQKDKPKTMGVYAICFASGHVKFGRASNLMVRTSQYRRETAIAGGANVYMAASDNPIQSERDLLDEAMQKFTNVIGELFLYSDEVEVCAMLMRNAKAKTSTFRTLSY